jgi:uncharacterized membrane protein HdeD (DUF308 family)/predicted flap endonuclease-1-like 5' DNA nuclease
MSSNSVGLRNSGSHWWLVLIQGIAAVILGVLLLTRPAVTIVTLVWFLGLYWLVTGIVTLVSLLWDRSQWGLKLFTGVLGIVAGLFIVQNPLISSLVVPAASAIWLGILGIAIGIAQLIQALRGGGWGIAVLGVLSIIVGFLLITNPVIAGLSLAFALGFILIIGGILAIFAAFKLRGLKKEYETAQAVADQETTSRSVDAANLDLVGAGSRAARTGGSSVEAMAVAGVAATGAVVAGATKAGDNVTASQQSAIDLQQNISGWGDGTSEALSRAGGSLEDVAGSAVGLAPTALNAVVGDGEDIVEGVESLFTGNVDLKDLDDLAKFKSPLEFIEGIGPAYAEKLKAIGIGNCLDLIKRGYNAKGRAEIAERSEISGRSILTWVNHVDLYRIKGVGSEYADLLEAAGVDTVVELAQRNPTNLTAKMNEVNLEKQRVRKTPNQSQVEDWVSQAKGLPRIITY